MSATHPVGNVPADANVGCPGTDSQQAGESTACAGCPNQPDCQTAHPVGEVPSDANAGCPGTASEQAGQSTACGGCPNQAKCQSGKGNEGNNEAIDLIGLRLKENIRHKILVLSGKGGVGKSTFSVQLCHALVCLQQLRQYWSKQYGEAAINELHIAGLTANGDTVNDEDDDNDEDAIHVGLLDVDICGPSTPRMLGVEGAEVTSTLGGWQPVYVREGLSVMSVGFLLPKKDDAIIWRGVRKTSLITQFLRDVIWGELDYLVVDSPPGTSDEHISLVQLLKSADIDGAVLITTPQEVSLMDVRKEIDFCRKSNTPILGVVENMSGFVCPNCSHCTDMFFKSTGGAVSMCQELNVPFLGSIPLDPGLSRACEQGQSIFDFAGTKLMSPGAEALANVVWRLLQSIHQFRTTKTA